MLKRIILGLSIVFMVSCFMDSKDANTSGKEIPQISSELLSLEEKYKATLQPISKLKSRKPHIYWFIVSWLNTNYRTPNWNGYASEDWQSKTKERGIDCSGFARVMQDKVFNKSIRGGSQGILNNYSIRKSKDELKMGDLVFFKAPFAKNNKIVHVGVYLEDGYFVHATSANSAAQGFGLNINSLVEPFWAQDFVTGGTIK